MSFEKRRVGANRHIVYLSERGEVQELALQNYVQELTLHAGLEGGCPAGFAGSCSYGAEADIIYTRSCKTSHV